MRRWSLRTRAEFMELVYAGCSVLEASRRVGVPRTTAQRWWDEAAPMGIQLARGPRGGIASPPRLAPPDLHRDQPDRQRRPLSFEDRAQIAAGRQAGLTLEQIGELIGRDRSVVCNELNRNSDAQGRYRAQAADAAAWHKRRRPKVSRLEQNPRLSRKVEGWLDEGWSPRLISTCLKADHPDTIMECVSHETIYQTLYAQGRGVLRQDLHRQLSLGRASRRPREATRDSRRASLYREAFTISDRPAEVADRAVPGHWEGDLILGTGNKSAVGTLVERSTRFTILLHLPTDHGAEAVAEAMIREMGKLPEHLRRSITWDRGSELAEYARIQLELKAPVFFCDPHSPWQRGTNENTNRLLRHWLTKGTDLSVHSQADLNRYAASLNARPRPTLDLDTPAQRLNALLKNGPQLPPVASTP